MRISYLVDLKVEFTQLVGRTLGYTHKVLTTS